MTWTNSFTASSTEISLRRRWKTTVLTTTTVIITTSHSTTDPILFSTTNSNPNSKKTHRTRRRSYQPIKCTDLPRIASDPPRSATDPRRTSWGLLKTAWDLRRTAQLPPTPPWAPLMITSSPLNNRSGQARIARRVTTASNRIKSTWCLLETVPWQLNVPSHITMTSPEITRNASSSWKMWRPRAVPASHVRNSTFHERCWRTSRARPQTKLVTITIRSGVIWRRNRVQLTPLTPPRSELSSPNRSVKKQRIRSWI